MSEEKKDEAVFPAINVLKMDARPNMCPIEAPLELEIMFTSDGPIPNTKWRVKYVVDTVHHRHEVVLGETKEDDVEEGDNEMHFAVDRIDVAGIAPSTLSNAGLLVATLVTRSGAEVLDVNAVVQVAREGDAFSRCILDPLS